MGDKRIIIVNGEAIGSINRIPQGGDFRSNLAMGGKAENICPFELLKNLHPSPAVCGYPKNAALNWINTLESFPRGNYASPMGWVDASGNASFLVAIRGARYIQEILNLLQVQV